MPMCGDCEIVKAAKKLPPMGGTDDWELRAALARSFRPRKESASSKGVGSDFKMAVRSRSAVPYQLCA